MAAVQRAAAEATLVVAAGAGLSTSASGEASSSTEVESNLDVPSEDTRQMFGTDLDDDARATRLLAKRS